jgi:hypothetical protein
MNEFSVPTTTSSTRPISGLRRDTSGTARKTGVLSAARSVGTVFAPVASHKVRG